MTECSGTAAAPRRRAMAGVLAFVVTLYGCLQGTAPQPSPDSRTVTDEATRLDEVVASLYGDGKLREAIPVAEQSLQLRETTLGREHPDVADSLNNLGLLHKSLGAYSMAEAMYLRALKIQEQALGPMHLSIATSLNNLAGIYVARGAYEQAEPLLRRALEIRETALGPEHLEVANILDNLAELHRLRGQYKEAEPLYLRALGIEKRELGPTHPEVAVSLNNLASLYFGQATYAKAEPLYVEALQIREKSLGPLHPDVAQALNNLAVLYNSQGKYSKAIPLHERALNINETTFGPMHRSVASTLQNLAVTHAAQGDYTRAEALFLRALNIFEKTMGPDHPDVAACLTSLAGFYLDQGMYTRGEPLLVRSLHITEKRLGPAHPDVAMSLNNLAMNYQDQGAYEAAKPLYERALQIREQAFGTLHPDVATSLNNLGGLYSARHDHKRAESLYRKALEIREKVLGPDHPDVARELNNLGTTYRALGDYARAESLHLRALEIRQRSLGPQHPDVATSLNNLAGVRRAKGDYASAEQLHRRALDIRRRVLGELHPDVALSLTNLAHVLRARGAHTSAMHLIAQAANLRDGALRIGLAPLSSHRKRALMALQQSETESLISLQADSLPNSRAALDLALTVVLRRKGAVLDSLVDHQRTLHDHLTPDLREKLAQLADASAQLSSRFYAPPDAQPAERPAAEVTQLHDRIDALEAELNAASAELRVETKPVTIAQVQSALPRDAALIEIVRYRRFDATRSEDPWREPRYIAYILPWRGAAQWVALGEAAAIDARIDAAIEAMRDGSEATAAKTALRRLDALVYAPIRARLTGISHVILSPDGKLNLIPFEALVDPQGRYELEHRLVSYVTSGRDLLRLSVRAAPRSAAAIVADPDYGAGTRFRRIAGARTEAEVIHSLVPGAQMLTGSQATKAVLAGLKSPAVLHIATHGFYAREGAPPPAGPALRAERGMTVEGALPSAPPPVDDLVDALDRAGLALAGSNTRPDGIVSAREIAGFDWWGTQLVVLSACETGIGMVPSGEGVYGLRRAVVMAGARSQIVSLWNVSDPLAPVLMRELYGELMRGTGRAEALRRAKLRVLRQPRFAHPYYWAAFVMAGDWTPLDQEAMSPREPQR